MPETKISSTVKAFAFVTIAVLTGAIVYIGYPLLRVQNTVQQPIVQDVPKNDAPDRLTTNHGLVSTATSPLSGSVVFTGRPKEVQEDTFSDFSLYTMDVSAFPAEVVPAVPEASVTAFAEFENPQDPANYFVSTVSDASATYEAENESQVSNQIHYVDVANGVTYFIPSAYGNSTRNLAVSTSERLAFNRAVSSADLAEYGDFTSLDNWELVVLYSFATAEEELVVPGAIHPRWSPDGTKLTYLKDDGLYLYDFSLGEDTKIVATDYDPKSPDTSIGLTPESMYNISPDGRFMVWTTPWLGLITVMEITSWEPFAYEERGRIVSEDTEYYDPQFSPDSTSYIVSAIDGINKSDDRVNPRFQVRPSLGRQVLFEQPIPSDLNFDDVFIDDWITAFPQTSADS